MLRTLLTAFVFISVSLTCYSQDSLKQEEPSRISGFITGKGSKPVAGANIVIQGTIDGAVSDEKGYYEFETGKTGSVMLLVTAIDYGNKPLVVELKPGSINKIDFKLAESEVTTDEILVTASSYTSGENSKVTLTPLEIVRIPGADADLYRAITTFPGSNQVDEGSKITVRGGDPNEVLTILDQASLYHPFVFDDNFQSSSYSTIDPWSLKGINFTSGGFSARFGNALSAVLDLRSYDLPRSTGMFFILGLANAGLSGVYLAKSGKYGASFSVSQTFLKPFLKLNSRNAEYSTTPAANGAGGTISYKISESSYLKLYANYSGDEVGIKNSSPSYNGFFESRTKNYFTNLKYSIAPDPASLLNIGISLSSFNRDLKYGILNTASNELYAKLRADYSYPVSSKFTINAGAEYEYNRSKVNGTVPQYSYNISLNAPSFNISSNSNTARTGAYAEGQYKLKKFFVIGGIRADHHSLSNKTNFDPRISIGYQLNKNNVLRAASGIYHQYPALENYNRTFNNSLEPESAVHYILGYEFNKESDIIFRLEGFYKDYKSLPGYSPQSLTLASTGSGFSRGVDVFLKYRKQGKFTGWLSYSYINSKRRQYDGAPLSSAAYDIINTLTIVSSYNFTDMWTFGATYRLSTGKPYTPVTGSYFDPRQNVYVPVYADFNSSRFPTYQRIDINAQHIFALFGKFAVAFAALNNVFNMNNLYGYTYNRDYTKQIEIESLNKRTVYFGIGLQL
jgi:hypothetical protein